MNADGSARDPTAPTVGINVVCKGRREHLHFLVPTGQPLAVLFDTWSSRFPRPPLSDVPAAPSATGGGANGGNKRAHARAATAPPDPPIPPQSLGPPFIFTFAGRVLGPDETADGVGLEEGDSLVAVEVVDLAREPGKGEDDAVTGNPLTKAAKKNLQAVKTQVEAVLDDVCVLPARLLSYPLPLTLTSPALFALGSVRERLKLVFRQYETRERQFEAIVRSKDLEILLAKARAEQCVSLWLRPGPHGCATTDSRGRAAFILAGPRRSRTRRRTCQTRSTTCRTSSRRSAARRTTCVPSVLPLPHLAHR